MAQYLFEAGRWDDALVELEALFELGADVRDIELVGGRGLAALIAVHRDDRTAAAAHLRAAAELPNLVGQRNYGEDLLRARAAVAERDGRPGDAAALMSAAIAAANVDGQLQTDYWLPDLVRCAIAVGDRTATEAAAARCEQEASRRGGPFLAAAARRCRGLADADPVPLAEAVAYYRTARRPWELGQALEDLAVVCAAGGDEAGARVALREATEIYGDLGAEWDLMRADARLRPYGVRRRRAGARRPSTGWPALTPTETKVAYLVGEGLSNPEIGARLFLSRYTVQAHVARILGKLQVRSRVEVAREVARRTADDQRPPARSTA